jgi:hypothetical protein
VGVVGVSLCSMLCVHSGSSFFNCTPSHLIIILTSHHSHLYRTHHSHHSHSHDPISQSCNPAILPNAISALRSPISRAIPLSCTHRLALFVTYGNTHDILHTTALAHGTWHTAHEIRNTTHDIRHTTYDIRHTTQNTTQLQNTYTST